MAGTDGVDAAQPASAEVIVNQAIAQLSHHQHVTLLPDAEAFLRQTMHSTMALAPPDLASRTLGTVTFNVSLLYGECFRVVGNPGAAQAWDVSVIQRALSNLCPLWPFC